MKSKIVFLIAVVLLAASLILINLKANYWTISIIFASALIMFLFFVDKAFKLKLERKHYIYAALIVATSYILAPLFSLIPNYDKLLHFIHPILLSPIALKIVSKSNLNIRQKLMFVFFIIIASYTIFEVGEYLLDKSFDLGLQGTYLRNPFSLEKTSLKLSAIDDTMIDMIFVALGSLTYFIFSYIKLGKNSRF